MFSVAGHFSFSLSSTVCSGIDVIDFFVTFFSLSKIMSAIKSVRGSFAIWCRCRFWQASADYQWHTTMNWRHAVKSERERHSSERSRSLLDFLALCWVDHSCSYMHAEAHSVFLLLLLLLSLVHPRLSFSREKMKRERGGKEPKHEPHW